MQILVVDDLAANRKMVTDMLTYAGHQVHVATDGKTALDILEQQSVQLVISDWMMPEMTGIELTNEIRKRFTDTYIYVILTSARNERNDMIEALESGADDFMARPFSPPELMARLAIGHRLVDLENRLKQQTLDIARSKSEWEATTDSIPQLVSLVDNTGKVIRINGTVQRWGLGWTDEAKDHTLPDLLKNVYPDFAAAFTEIWPEAHKTLRTGMEYEFEGEDARMGHYFTVQFEPINPFSEFTPDAPSFAAVSIMDITDRKKLELRLEAEHEKAENLLLNMLPRPVAEKLKQGTGTIADHYNDVTVMFADLVGFTQLTASLDPNELMDLLNSVFSAFDMLADRHHVEKIKTIGDAYMIVAGAPEPAEDHAQRVMRMAIAMQGVIQQINSYTDNTLSLRIGIHSGAVVAGVIGMKKLNYDLWGETVNTASRMESNGVNGRIQVSEQTYTLIKDDFAFESRGEIEAKGLGKVSTYLLKEPEPIKINAAD